MSSGTQLLLLNREVVQWQGVVRAKLRGSLPTSLRKSNDTVNVFHSGASVWSCDSRRRTHIIQITLCACADVSHIGSNDSFLPLMGALFTPVAPDHGGKLFSHTKW